MMLVLQDSVSPSSLNEIAFCRSLPPIARNIDIVALLSESKDSIVGPATSSESERFRIRCGAVVGISEGGDMNVSFIVGEFMS